MVQAGNLIEPDGPNDNSYIVDNFANQWDISIRPDDAQTALVAGIIVHRSALDGQRFAIGTNECVDWFGVLAQDQVQFVTTGNYDVTSPLRIVTRGFISATAGVALAVDVPVCSDATGRLKLWDALMAAQAYIGRTRSSCTVVGETVQVELGV